MFRGGEMDKFEWSKASTHGFYVTVPSDADKVVCPITVSQTRPGWDCQLVELTPDEARELITALECALAHLGEPTE